MSKNICKCGNVIDNPHDELCHSCQIAKLVEDNPNVPSAVYDIEASQEIAEMWYDMYGY